MAEKLGTLFQLYYRPARALSTILDSGSLGLAVIASGSAPALLRKSLAKSAAWCSSRCCSHPRASRLSRCGTTSAAWAWCFAAIIPRFWYASLMCWAAANLPAWLAELPGACGQFLDSLGCGTCVFPGARGRSRFARYSGAGIGRAIGTVFGGAAASVGGFYVYADLWRNALLFHLPARAHLALYPVPSQSRLVAVALAAACARAKTSTGTWKR